MSDGYSVNFFQVPKWSQMTRLNMSQKFIEQYVIVYCFLHLCYVLGGRGGFSGGKMVLRCMLVCFENCLVVDMGNDDHG